LIEARLVLSSAWLVKAFPLSKALAGSCFVKMYNAATFHYDQLQMDFQTSHLCTLPPQQIWHHQFNYWYVPLYDAISKNLITDW
jgi:hypothetical protein